MLEHKKRCPKCCGKGEVIIRSKRCKIGLHDWYFLDYLPKDDSKDMKWLRKCARCGRVERGEFGLAVNGEGYQHFYPVKLGKM